MSITNKSQLEVERAAAGMNGTRPLSGTTAKPCKAIGFIADSDTVFESIKDENDVEQIENIEYDGWTLKEGQQCFFGFVTSLIKLASGSGQYYLAE